MPNIAILQAARVDNRAGPGHHTVFTPKVWQMLGEGALD